MTARRRSQRYAPERTLYVTSFTKITVPGLRIGYLAAPDRYIAAVANRHLVSNWMATPIVAEIATKWVSDGTAMELVDWQRAAIRRRHAIAAEVLGAVSSSAFASRKPASLATSARRPQRGRVRLAGPFAGCRHRAGRVLPHVGGAVDAGGAHLAGFDGRSGTAHRARPGREIADGRSRAFAARHLIGGYPRVPFYQALSASELCRFDIIVMI
jgi:hypothetical protein